MSRRTTAQRAKRDKARAAAKSKALRTKRIKIAAGVSVVAVAIVLLMVSTWPQSDLGSTTAEAWDLPALEGESRISIDDFNGKPTVAAFFASWCTVCEHEIPGFKTLSEQIGDDINFVGINSQDNGGGIGDAQKWGITGLWPIARDIGGRAGSGLSVDTFGARGMPLTVLYDEHGTVAHVQRGGISPDGLLDLLEALFGYTA